MGIEFTLKGGNFAGISLGPRGVADDKGIEAGELERELLKLSLSNRDFKSKGLGEL